MDINKLSSKSLSVNNLYPSPGLIQSSSENYSAVKIVIVMVGLPLRGKSFIARKLSRFLAWLGFVTRIFNVGHGLDNKTKKINLKQTKDIRKICAFNILHDAIAFLQNGGSVVIYDGNNCSPKRRKDIKKIVDENLADEDYQIVWIESICNDETKIQRNMDEQNEKNIKEIERNMKYYKEIYKEMDDINESYIKIINFEKIVCNKIGGYITAKILYFLVNVKMHQKPLFFTRHGESEYNVLDKIGGDSPLSPRGREYAKSIYKIMWKQPEFDKDKIRVFCSTLKRSVETVEISGLNNIKHRPIQWHSLSEIESGLCDGMSYTEIKLQLPEEYSKRQEDKLNYRYPKGESYKDLIMRLEPILLELERLNNVVVVVGHRAVLRCLYGYFCNIPEDKIPHVDMPLHTIIKLEPFAFGCKETRFSFENNLSEFSEDVKVHRD